MSSVSPTPALQAAHPTEVKSFKMITDSFDRLIVNQIAKIDSSSKALLIQLMKNHIKFKMDGGDIASIDDRAKLLHPQRFNFGSGFAPLNFNQDIETPVMVEFIE